jgi:hypothetical protein
MGLDELLYCDAYAEFLMTQSAGERLICNGDTLLDCMESGYLFKEFLASIEYEGEEVW